MAGFLSAKTISTITLTGGSNLVAFNGSLDTITLGWVGCGKPDTGTCTYGGSQSLSPGTLTWQFQTPNTSGNITYDDRGDVYGPTGGTFSASDGVDSVNGTYVFTGWTYDDTPYGSDDQFLGIDLSGTITVTGVTLEGGSDPNEAAFESFLDLPGATSYNYTLDVGDCTAGAVFGNKTVACIQAIPDPTGYFNSLTLTPQSTTPEPGTLGLMAAGLLAAFAVRKKLNATKQ